MRYVTRKPNSNNFYVRVPIPQEHQKELGKREIWRSLRTSDKKEAHSRAYRAVAEIKEGFTQKELEPIHAPLLADPSDDQLERAANKFYHYLVENDLEERATDPASFRETWSPRGNKRTLKLHKSQFAVGDYSEVDVEHWAHEFGFDLQPGHPKERYFAQLMMRAVIEAQRRAIDHDRGKVDGKPKDKLFRAPHTPNKRTEAFSPNKPVKSGPTLLELFEKHRANLSSKLRPDTLVQREKPLKRFAEFVGETTPATEITKAQARDWRDALRNWPVKADQRNDFIGLNFDQVLKKNEALGINSISERTMAKYVSEVSAVFTWMVKEAYVEANVFDNLHVNPSRDASGQRAFTDGQIAKLFASPLLAGCAGDKRRQVSQPGQHQVIDWRFWLPVLAIFTGARQGELAQLELEDVKEEDGIHYLSITNRGEDPEKSVKNKFSVRSIPLHPKVLELGFLAYVETVRERGATQVFPDAERDARGMFSGISKFYQNYFKAIKLSEEGGNTAVFHAFRHRFTDELRRHYPDEWIKPLLGHSGRNITSGYGVGETLSLQKRSEMIKSLEYSMVDWSYLSRKQLLSYDASGALALSYK